MKFYTRKMARRRSRPLPLPRSSPGVPTCCFCGLSEDDELEFGKLHNHDGIVTHYYCLLLSSNMEQNGSDNEGILGFMPADIEKELRRGKKIHCVYCRRIGATLGCCNSRCKRVFHLPCGIKEGSLHQFFGEFRSYCMTHRIKQEIDDHIKDEAAAAGAVTCYICYEDVCPKNNMQTLWAPCCRKNAWFHRKCVQRLALSAGYFFKCPLCNNKDDFQKAMQEHGIFIPSQDASWELVPNAYQELLHRHNRCDAVECLCSKGRNHTSVNAKWELVLCRLCGSQGVHRACGHLKWANAGWECEECVGMLGKTNTGGLPSASPSTEAPPGISAYESDSDSDSDISVGGNPSPLTVTSSPDSPPPTTPPIRLRPGPRSFKLQQAVHNAKSIEITTTPNSVTSVPENLDISLSSKSDTKDAKIDAVSDEKEENKVSPAKSPSLKTSSSLSENICKQSESTVTEPTNIVTEPISTVKDETNVLLSEADVKSIESRRRVAEVIVIDSDDEVEIISVTSKPNILTTKDGTQIPIHNLSQTTAEPHKAVGDVTIVEPMPFNELIPQSNGNSAANNSMTLNKTSASKMRNPALISTITRVNSSRVLESPVIRKTIINPVTRKLLGNNEVPPLVKINKDVQENSVMNLKITNVTSLCRDHSSNPFLEPNSFNGIGSANNIHVNGSPEVQIIRTPSLETSSSQSCINSFQLSTAAIRDINSKRKSEEHKSSSNLSDKEIMEYRKKARICVPSNSGISVQDETIAWSININDENGASIPLLVRSAPLNCSSKSNRFEQSAATSIPNGLKTSSNEGMQIIHNPDARKTNGFHNNPPNPSSTSLYPRKSFTMPMPMAYMQVPRTMKTYSAEQFSDKNCEPDIINVHKTVNVNEQGVVNVMQNLVETIPRYSKQSEQASSQQVFNSGKIGAQTSQNMDKEIEKRNKSDNSFETNISTPDLIFYNTVRGNSKKVFAGTSGNQPSTNDGAKINQSIKQLTNGIQIPSSCDGDAGSGPAAEARSTHQAIVKSPVRKPAEPISVSYTDARQNSVHHSSISTCVPTNSTAIVLNPSGRKYCDKPRMIPENVPLRNINFHIMDSESVQIHVHDIPMLNIHTDAEDAGPRRSMNKQKLFSNESSSKLDDIGNDCRMNMFIKCDLPSNESRSESIDSARKLTPPKENNVNDSEVSSDTIKKSSIIEIKCRVMDKMKPKIDCIQKMNFATEISSNESKDRNSLCTWHKENLFKKKRPGPAFTKCCRNLKNLCEKDENIIVVSKTVERCRNVEETPVKTVENKNSFQSVSSINFFSKTVNCLTDKKKDKLSTGLNKVSKRSIRNFDDSLKLNLPIDCYTNCKKTEDRYSRVQTNVEDSENKMKDSVKKKSNNVNNLGAVNGTRKISPSSSTSKLNECFHTSIPNESIVETVEKNSTSNRSYASLSCENIKNNVSLKDGVKTNFKDKNCSRLDGNIHGNESNGSESGCSIKVKINLDKIQHFIDNKPHLFDKHKGTKTERTNNKQATEKYENHSSVDSNERSYLCKIRASKNIQDTKNLKPRKRFKYDSELLRERSKS